MPLHFRQRLGGIMGMDEICLATLAYVEAAQEDGASAAAVRGEFPMTLRCPEPRNDYNFLSGYALLHLAVCSRMLLEYFSPAAHASATRILKQADQLLPAYQSRRGTLNWYHGRLSGDHIPPDFAWPGDRILSLSDDLDDTAISVMLVHLCPDIFSLRPFPDSVFTDRAYDPNRDRLGAKSLRRLQLAGVDSGVYLSWALSPEDPPGPNPENWTKVPPHNSVELVTSANVWTALCLRSPHASDLEGYAKTVRFVNQATAIGLDRLVCHDDPTYFELFASYYPRVPFAPLSFLLRSHALSGRTLLTDETTRLIADAVSTVNPHCTARANPFAAPAYWANAAGWCVYLGLLPESFLEARVRPLLDQLADRCFDTRAGRWPDFVFFLAAHIGDYSGIVYSHCLMVETLTLAARPGR
jgi:hypothetical protein